MQTSQGVFQRAKDQILDDLPGIVNIVNDIVLYGTDERDQNGNLHWLMHQAQKKCLVFNASKCKLKEESMPFFEQTYGKNRVRPDSAKTQVINDLSVPVNVAEVQSFVGISYLAPFIPNLSLHTPLK